MSSVTSYCPTLRGSCGGGYEGGVHLFTPGKAGAKKTKQKKEQEGFVGEGEGTRRQCRAQSKREKKKKEGGR